MNYNDEINNNIWNLFKKTIVIISILIGIIILISN